MHYLVKAACAAAGIVDLFIALKADRYRQITDTNHLFAHFLVNQRAVCERMECAVVVLLTQTDQIFFAHERFSACIHIKVNTKLLSLCNDAVQILIGKVQLVPILSSPAAGTVEIAGGCGYDNSSKFASAFRDIMGETPAEYRKMHGRIKEQ